MGHATLGYAGGPAATFRVDPEKISWGWQILTNVVETIGGRVIQVLGAYLDDLVIEGSFGQDHSTPDGVSWRQAEAFLRVITSIMEFQSRDANRQSQMHVPAVFTYPPKGWRFQVYVKDFSDADGGGSVVLTPGKFNNRYRLTLFIVQDASEALVVAGTTNGVLSQKANEAISSYFARVSDGIGWHFGQYNGPVGGINKKWIQTFESSQNNPVSVPPVPSSGHGGGSSGVPAPTGGGSGGGGSGGEQKGWFVTLPANANVYTVSFTTMSATGTSYIAGPFSSRDAAVSFVTNQLGGKVG